MCVSSKQTKSVPWEGGGQSHTPNQEAICNWCLLGKGTNQWSATGSINHSPGQTPCPGVVGQHKTDPSFYFVGLFVMFLFWYLCLTRFCLFFIFLLCLRVSENMKLCGKGKNMINIYCVKKLNKILEKKWFWKQVRKNDSERPEFESQGSEYLMKKT